MAAHLKRDLVRGLVHQHGIRERSKSNDAAHAVDFVGETGKGRDAHTRNNKGRICGLSDRI